MAPEPLMSGFPPPAESRVTLANWQDPPFNRWSFQHLRELIPTQRISRRHSPRRALPPYGAAGLLDDITVYRLTGYTSTFAEVIAETWTDAVVVLHEGGHVVVGELGDLATAGAPGHPHHVDDGWLRNPGEARVVGERPCPADREQAGGGCHVFSLGR